MAVPGRKAVPANETPNQKLVRLANKRVNKAITQIRLIGNLGGYGPTEQQRNNIIRVIDIEVARMKRNISTDTPAEEEGFKLA